VRDASRATPEDSHQRDVLRAALWAIRMHDRQLRKDRRTPYFVHPVGVMRFLSSDLHIEDPEILCAALLHDVLEDTSARVSDLSRRFGPRVARIVQELTLPVDMHGPGVPNSEKTVALLRDVAVMSWDAILVKLADRFDNLRDMANARWGTRQRHDYERQTGDLLRAVRRRWRRHPPPSRLQPALRRARAAVRSRVVR
jgi:(p)ppGpp synthase/HD superfamily hydrolase